MADRFPIRYEIGGKITAAVLDRLLRQLLDIQMTREYGGCDDEDKSPQGSRTDQRHIIPAGLQQ